MDTMVIDDSKDDSESEKQHNNVTAFEIEGMIACGYTNALGNRFLHG